MTQRLHLVFGGELVDPQKTEFRNLEDIHNVGLLPDCASAYDAWKAKARRTVDNAHMGHFITHLRRLLDEATPTSATAELAN